MSNSSLTPSDGLRFGATSRKQLAKKGANDAAGPMALHRQTLEKALQVDTALSTEGAETARTQLANTRKEALRASLLPGIYSVNALLQGSLFLFGGNSVFNLLAAGCWTVGLLFWGRKLPDPLKAYWAARQEYKQFQRFNLELTPPQKGSLDERVTKLLEKKLQRATDEVAKRLNTQLAQNKDIAQELFPAAYGAASGKLKPDALHHLYDYLAYQSIRLERAQQGDDAPPTTRLEFLQQKYSLLQHALKTGNYIAYTRPDPQGAFGQSFDAMKVDPTFANLGTLDVQGLRDMLVHQEQIGTMQEEISSARERLNQAVELAPFIGDAQAKEKLTPLIQELETAHQQLESQQQKLREALDRAGQDEPTSTLQPAPGPNPAWNSTNDEAIAKATKALSLFDTQRSYLEQLLSQTT